MLYFAYGSNMSTRRLASRIEGFRVRGMAFLDGHALRFHKAGQDGSAKCDACPCPDATVIGVLYELDAHCLDDLDAFEGDGYRRETVELRDASGKRIKAVTYLATRIDASLQPFDWYLAHVLTGAREHHLPADYVAAIARNPSIPDTNTARREREIAADIWERQKI